jgi:hypothetical protein
MREDEPYSAAKTAPKRRCKAIESDGSDGDDLTEWENSMVKTKPRKQRVRAPCDPNIWGDWQANKAKDLGTIGKLFGKNKAEMQDVKGTGMLNVADFLCKAVDMDKARAIAAKTVPDDVPARWAKRDVICHIISSVVDEP